MSNVWMRSHRNLRLCLVLLLLSFGRVVFAATVDAYLAIRGIQVSHACFGADGLDLTANHIDCNKDEKICIWDVDYGVKTVAPNVSCPHAAAHNVPASCCVPDNEDCVVRAQANKRRDLILECHYLSESSCLLRVDRHDVKDICTNRPGVTMTTFRSITYVCAPYALSESGDDPCKLLPEPDNQFWANLDVRNREKEEAMRRMTLSGSEEETATVLIASIIGFSIFLVVFILLMILAVRCTGWMVDPEDDLRTPSSNSKGYSYGLHSPDMGWKPFHQPYNVYEPYPRFHEHKPPNTVFSSNNEAKASKRFYYKTKYKSSHASDDASVRGGRPKRFMIGRTKRGSSQGSLVTSGRSSSQSYRSGVDSPTNGASCSNDQSVDGRTPPPGYRRDLYERRKALSIQDRFQRMFYGDYFAPRRLRLKLGK